MGGDTNDKRYVMAIFPFMRPSRRNEFSPHTHITYDAGLCRYSRTNRTYNEQNNMGIDMPLPHVVPQHYEARRH